MNAPELWWVLSLSAGCLYALLAGTEYRQSLLARLAVFKGWPHLLKLSVHCLYVPLLLVLCVSGFSDWLTEQSFARWRLTLEEFGKPAGILLSIQALYFLLHGRVFGAWALLLVSTLTLQLWLYYQALGIDFGDLGLTFAATVLVMLTSIQFTLHAIDPGIKQAFARPLAGLVLLIQWLFATTTVAVTPATVTGFAWVTLDTTLVPAGLMLLLILVGYVWQAWSDDVSKATGA